MALGRVVVPLKPGSDGDATHRPTSSVYTEVNPPTLYLERLGTQWMQARGEARPGTSYSLQRLPNGYALFKRPRPKQPKTFDNYLYGHPDNKPFDSPNRFFPHFVHLMENNGNRIGCPCTLCNPAGGFLPRLSGGSSTASRSSSQSSSKRANTRTDMLLPTPAPTLTVPHQKGRPKLIGTGMDTSRVDEEGTPDVYRNLVDKLKRNIFLDEAIIEPLSLDWRAEQELVPKLQKKLLQDPQWIPRAGDIVLYLREWPAGLEIVQHPSAGQYQFYDAGRDAFLGVPAWEVGHVGQPPAEANEMDDDLQTAEEWNVGMSGVRVEQLPNPNDPTNKFLSKRYKYVPVQHTRPFILWKDYLVGVPEVDWHPTIVNALTIMSSFSLMGKHRFRGQWPDAQIYCHGIFTGSEMLAVGDSVRLLPKSGESVCTDILVVKSIRLKLSNLDKASGNDYDQGRPYNSEAWVFGSAYTSRTSRASGGWLGRETTESPKAASGYSNWQPLHPPSKELAVPFSRLLGRLHEHDVVRIWFPSNAPPALDQGREGLLEGRAFARANDRRLTSSFGANWFWADSRAEALNLETVNGLEVSKFDNERDPRTWRKTIKTIDGVSADQARMDAQGATGGNKSLRAFMASAKAKLPTGGRGVIRDDLESTSTSMSFSHGHKRIPAIHLSDDSEDVFRQHTHIMRNEPSTGPKKRAKVTVVID